MGKKTFLDEDKDVGCPECRGMFTIRRGTKAGDAVVCPNCEADFEIGQISPLILMRLSGGRT